MSNYIRVEISGTSPLLMHAFPLQPIEGMEKMTPDKQAEFSAYRDPEGELCVPARCLQRALVAAAAYSKGKGRASLQKVAAACMFVAPQYLLLGRKDYAVDSQAVVVPATKGRVVRHRPRIDTPWKLTFEVEYDPTMLSADNVRRIVDDMGTKVGLLDFRPEKKGPYGRCVVTRWEPFVPEK